MFKLESRAKDCIYADFEVQDRSDNFVPAKLEGLPMIRTSIWANKDDSPTKWESTGLECLAICNTACTITLVLWNFAR